MTVGDLIKSARKRAGLTQVELGKLLGVSGSMIGQWENNFRKPKSGTIQKIAEALGKPFMEVFQVYVEEKDAQIMNRLNAIKADIEFEGLEHREKAEIAIQEQISEFARSANGRTIVSCYMELNDTGKEEAVKRIMELAEISYYKKDYKDDFDSDEEDCFDEPGQK